MHCAAIISLLVMQQEDVQQSAGDVSGMTASSFVKAYNLLEQPCKWGNLGAAIRFAKYDC